MTRTSTTAALLVGLAILLAAAPARAQGGVRAGVSGDPDQFYFGGHYEFGPVADQLWFRPNAEIGVGNDLTLVALNLEFAYKTQWPRRDWRAYFGGGPALNIVRTSRNTDPQGGFNILVGLEHRRGLFTEVKLGFVDSPEVKFGVGYTFH